jgi:hypothetical protein
VLLQPQTLAGLDPELLLELPQRHHCSSLQTSNARRPGIVCSNCWLFSASKTARIQ